MIKTEGGKYVLYSKDGSKKLGEFATEREAQAREAEILKIEHAKEAVGAGGEYSLSDKVAAVQRAYYDQAGAATPLAQSACVWEVYDDYAIVAMGDKYFQLPYTVGADGAITFGAPIEVKLQYVTANEAIEVLGEPTGKKWRVRVIKEGVSGTNWIYPRPALESLLPFVEGTPVFAFELSPGLYGHASDAVLKKARETGQQVGCLTNASLVDLEGVAAIDADLEVANESWSARLLSWFKSRTGTRGLSINGPCDVLRVQRAKEVLIVAKRFLGLFSVDLATIPGMGGGLLRATESVAEGEVMDLKAILALLKKAKREDLITKLGAEPTIEQAQEALTEALKQPVIIEEGGVNKALNAQEAQEMRDLLAQSRKDSCGAYLTLKLSESKLPDPVKKKLEKQYSDTLFAREALDAAITAEKEMLDALGHSGQVNGAGETRVEVSLEAQDKVQIALDKTLGVKVTGHDDIKPFFGLREAYVRITGDAVIEGRVAASRMRSQEAISSVNFPYLLGVTLNRRLVQDYRLQNYHTDRLISFQGSAPDFKTQEAIRVGYFGDLPLIDPENEDYLDTDHPNEEQVNYQVATRGRLLTVTRKTLINDDTSGITRRVRGWNRAAARTLARFLWGFYLNNATYDGDGTAWFTAGGGSHLNLQAVAISAAEISTAITALMDMTEPDSAEKLGLDEDMKLRLTLVVSHALWTNAVKINQAQYLDAAFTPNPVYHVFGANDERIVILALETDATDWGILCDPSDRDILEVKFLNGQVDPEIFIADQPTVGQMFVADKLQYKIRHEYGAELLDFRNAVKAIVA